MAPSIPDRWIPYKACGKVIPGTRFICFKVPLKKIVQKQCEEIWDIRTLLETIPNLGAVIDLTNTNRYYNPSELLNSGILYKKIYMPGRIIPPQVKVHEFMDAVDEFLGKDCESLIGVHCTHGLNRTGYMVCRYMRDRMGFDAKDAIQKFETARGYKIERDNYVAHLIGYEPPPPDLGGPTTIIPKSPVYEDHPGSYNDDQSRKTNGESRSSLDEYADQGDEDYYSGGRYVRHPSRIGLRRSRRENYRNYDGPCRMNQNSVESEFETARGYKIERDNYVAHLIGHEPPPPDLGGPANIIPKSPVYEDHPSSYNGDQSRKRNGESRSSLDKYADQGDEDYYSGGRYVREPSRIGPRRSRRENYRNYDGPYRMNRNNVESDKSEYEYDYKHDY